MNYADYKQNIVDQLRSKTGIDLVWEDFTLTNQKVISGKTIEVTLKPTEAGSVKFKGTATIRIDRMDLNNATYVFEWKGDAKSFDSDLFLNDQKPVDQAALLATLTSYLGVQFDLADFIPTAIDTTPLGDVSIELTALNESFYYFGTLRVTLTHPWVNHVIMDIAPTASVNVTAANIKNGILTVDGVVQTLPYTIPAGAHTIEIKNFDVITTGFTFLTPTRLKLLRIYNGNYPQLFKDCVKLTTIDEQCIHAAGGASTSMSLFFWGCTGLKQLPNILFMPKSSVYNISGLFRGTGITSISSTIFDNLEVLGAALDQVFMDTVNLTTVPVDIIQSFASTVTQSTQLFQNSGLVSIPATLFSGFGSLTNLTATFYGCTSLKAIPAGLLDDCVSLTSLSNNFFGCTSLTAIVQGIFDKLVNLTSANGVFSGCSGITAVRSDLLTKNVNLVQVNSLLKQTGISTLPSTLLATNTKLVYSSEFVAGAVNLTDIPDRFLATCPSLAVVSNMFDGCLGLTRIPDDLFQYTTNLTNVSQCFRSVPLEFAIPSNFFPGTKLNNILGVFSYSGLNAIPTGLFRNHQNIVTMSYAFAGTKLKVIPEGTFNITANTLQQAIAVFTDCTELTTIDAGAMVFTSTLTTTAHADYGNFLANCTKLTNLGANAISISGRVASLVSFMANCSAYRGSVSDLLLQTSIHPSTPATDKLDCNNMFAQVIWLRGTCMALWNSITGNATPSTVRIRTNFIDQCFLLTDYEDVGKPWWNVAISLARANNNPVNVFTLDDPGFAATKYGYIPKFATVGMVVDRALLSNSFGTVTNVPIENQHRVWLDRLFLAVGLSVPTDVTTFSINYTTRPTAGWPADSGVPDEIKSTSRIVFDRAVTDWVSVDQYVFCSLTT